MAYRPPVVQSPRGKRKGREVAEAQLRRQALAKALSTRLQALMLQMAQRSQPIIPPKPPFREHPAIPPQGPFRGSPAIPPQPPLAPNPHIPPAGPFATQPLDPGFDPRVVDPNWVPPSAYDWIRQPGFYDEAPPSGNSRAF